LVAWRATAIATVIGLIVALLAPLVLGNWHVSPPAISIIAGIILFSQALRIIMQPPGAIAGSAGPQTSPSPPSPAIAVFPVAIPAILTLVANSEFIICSWTRGSVDLLSRALSTWQTSDAVGLVARLMNSPPVSILSAPGIAAIAAIIALNKNDLGQEAIVVVTLLVVMVLNLLTSWNNEAILKHGVAGILPVVGWVLAVLQAALAVQIIIHALRVLEVMRWPAS
jgi:small neutral amino acid transporter SnatA (MarC family)